MSDFPLRIQINEEGPREGFQIESGPISTPDKVRFIEALAETGLNTIQCVSFVNDRKVPGWADADAVARLIQKRSNVRYTCLWLNEKGLNRAVASELDLIPRLSVSASESFSRMNVNMDLKGQLNEQKKWIFRFQEMGVSVDALGVSTAFGCNFDGDISVHHLIEVIRMSIDQAKEQGVYIKEIGLADTAGWATPVTIERCVGAVREKWPEKDIRLHIHDTRGTGIANFFAGLRLGVTIFDGSCGGLGGCPFAGHLSAAGNICTAEMVFLCDEIGIQTGVNLEKLIECAQMAEEIVGHSLPGKLNRSSSLRKLRNGIISGMPLSTI